MPLSAGKSKKAFSHNVEVEVAAGKPQAQAVAIAYRQAGEDGPEVDLQEAIEAGKKEAKAQARALSKIKIDCRGSLVGDRRLADIRPASSDFELLLDYHDLAVELEIELDGHIVSDLAPRVRLALDRAPSNRTRDAQGFLHVRDCNISKANICPYLGKEIPDSESMGLEAERVYNLYRDADALAAAAPTFERVPLMMHHVGVSADNPQKNMIIGTVSNVRWQAPYLVADLTVWDAAGIEAIESERQQELSPGYRYTPEMNSGVLDGKPYDGRMLNILANHLAIVDTGRTGPDVVVKDRNSIQ
jgi:hypothetical protein